MEKKDLTDEEILKMASMAETLIQAAVHSAGVLRKSMLEEGFSEAEAKQASLMFLANLTGGVMKK